MMLKKILKAKGLQETFAYQLSEKGFAISFVFLRSTLNTFLTYNLWVSSIPFYIKIIVSIVYCVGLFWVYIILCIVVKKYKESNFAVFVYLGAALEFFSKKKIFLGIGIACWGFVLPFFLTSVMKTQFLNLVVRGFIVF